MTTPPTIPLAPRPNWWSRNWKWFVPTGCVTLILLVAAFAAGILLLVSSTMKSSDVYKLALAKAEANPEVIRRIGQPLKPGWMFSGNISVAGPSGSADIAIPISGPKGSGTLYAVANKSAGEWRFRTLQVAVEGAPGRIELLSPGQGAVPQPREF